MGDDEQLQLFKERLERASKDPGDFVAFRETLSLAIYMFDLTATQIGDEFAVSKPTVGSWIKADSHPTAALVGVIYKWLGKKLKEKIHGRKSQKK